MANPNPNPKFVSVNLNKSYGRLRLPSSSRPSKPPPRSMVVLSRPRTASSSKLAVPPPLNLPSLRKEHQLHDPSNPAPGSAPGAAPAHPSPSIGWTKPNNKPPDDRPVRAAVLRGEDFPSLEASVAPKREEVLEVRSPAPVVHMRPERRVERVVDGRGDGREGDLRSGRNGDGFLPGPLPVMQLRHTSEWGDDERDTGNGRGFSGRGGYDYGSGRGGGSDADVGGASSARDFGAGDSTASSRGVGSWRGSSNDAGAGQNYGADRDAYGATRSSGLTRDVKHGAKYGQSHYADSARDGPVVNGSHDLRQPGRDFGYGHGVQDGYGTRSFQQNGSSRGRLGDAFGDRYREGDDSQNNRASKVPYNHGNKKFSSNDSIPSFGREKRFFSNNKKPFLEDAGLDSMDPFSGSFIGDVSLKVLRKKKDTLKQVDFHDPVRDSFEAELERVQRMQEEERQRVLEEQTRVMELARKEEEEREKLFREEEQRRKQLEDEAREALWRTEQEKLEASRKAEELRLAREEEKRRIQMEEERRKAAAHQKLMELEARIAKRQAETAANDGGPLANADDDQASGKVKEREIPRVADDGYWEDGEQMVERITSSASSDSSGLSRPFRAGSRPSSSKDRNSFFMDRAKHSHSWKRVMYDNGNTLAAQESEHIILQRDAFGTGRQIPRKGFYSRPEVPSVRSISKAGASDFHHSRGHGWDFNRDGDHQTNNNLGNHFLENDRFGTVGWNQLRSGINHHNFAGETLFQSCDDEGVSPFGRSRHFMRQPRVLPPPSFSSVHKNSFQAAPERGGSPAYSNTEVRYHTSMQNDDTFMQDSCDNGCQEKSWELGSISVTQDTGTFQGLNEKNTPRCDSQSSVSVSSPPTSPTHISHDDLEDSGDLSALPALPDTQQITTSGDLEFLPGLEDHSAVVIKDANSVPHREDDEWTIENNDEMQVLDEYDEDGNQEEEEDEHEGGCDNFSKVRNYGDLHLDLEGQISESDQLVLGFNEGVEVKIHSVDELESSSIHEKNIATGVNGIDGIYEHDFHVKNAFTDGVGQDPEVTDETEKRLQNLILEDLPANHPMGSSNPYETSALPANQQAESSSDLPNHSATSTGLSAVPAVLSQVNSPLELQFGLFSGPSLIPSPVPAIQIGSIQMPLHLHPPVGPSIGHMHSSHPPLFQFGQLRYPSPISQGILPMTQNMTYVQSSVTSSHPFAGSAGSILHNHGTPHSSMPGVQANGRVVGNNRPINGGKHFNTPQDKFEVQLNSLQGNLKDDGLGSQDKANSSSSGSKETEVQGAQDFSSQICSTSAGTNAESQGEYHKITTQCVSESRSPVGSRYSGKVSTDRGKRYVYTIKNTGTRPSIQGPDTSWVDHNGIQRKAQRNFRRTEFRVRESGRRRNHEGLQTDAYTAQGEKLGTNWVPGASVKTMSRRESYFNESIKSGTESQIIEGTSPSQAGKYKSKATEKEATSRRVISSINNSQSRDGSLKRNMIPEQVGDVPLGSGVVQIFKQPGIDIPSDEDDFIEVRSKRQMLNDKREQKEKEIKAKSKVTKAPRRPRSASQNNGVVSSLNTTLPPFGPPPSIASGESVQTNTKTTQSSSGAANSSDRSKHVQVSISDKKSAAVDGISSSLDSWSNSHVNQQVMSLTQTQLDDAMKPAQFDNGSNANSIGNATSISQDQRMGSTSNIVMGKNFSTSATLSSLLSREKIQFGAITTPAILPPVSRAHPKTIRSPSSVSTRRELPSNVSLVNLSPPNHDSTIFFEKDKCHGESPARLEDPEAEAEAAASAVAVAAITSDEIVGNNLGACSASNVSNNSNFQQAGINLSGGGSNAREMTSQSEGEESLTVSLPADLSLETPLLSPWPALSSPQSSSGPLLSHFPGTPSHFPLFDMNHVLGGQMLSFRSHEESAGTQSQPPKNNSLGSGSLGVWPQGAESFYGPSAGFPGPFINHPGGIPGMQGSHHMVFYNPFPPVGQFGLSFMGASTFVPPGKQPDWKHNPASSAVSMSQGETNNVNTVHSQQNSPSIQSSIQHLGSGAPLVPMPSHLPLFDMSTFQSSNDLPVQARWSHLPVQPLHNVPMPVHMEHHQVKSSMSSQTGHCLPTDSATGSSMFPESCSTTPLDSNRNFTISADPGTQFPCEHVLSKTSSSVAACIRQNGPLYVCSDGKNHRQDGTKSIAKFVANGNETDSMLANSSNSNTTSTGPSVKTQGSPSPSQQHLQPIGYHEQRGRMASSRRTGSGNDSHRRVGFQERSHGSRGDRNPPNAKVKKVYVAKQPTTAPATPM